MIGCDMARKPDLKPDDPAQYQRFLDLAEEVEAEGDDREIDKAVKRLAKHSRDKAPAKPAKKGK
jgi:hypothetical protein